jgi:hypothetical protein
MPFTKSQTEDLSELREMAYGWGKIVTRRAFGAEGPGLDLDFDAIESLAVDIGHAVIRGTIEEVLTIQSQHLGAHQPCPQCGRSCPIDKAPRTIAVRGGTIDYDEPIGHCPACRRDFFPPPPQLAAQRASLLARDPGEDPPGRGTGTLVPGRRGDARRTSRGPDQRPPSGADRS